MHCPDYLNDLGFPGIVSGIAFNMLSQFHPHAIKDFFFKRVWETPLQEMGVLETWLVTTLRIGHLLVRDLINGMITLRAMGLVYTTLLALVPLLAVSFSVLKGFGVHNQIEPMLLNLLLPLGDKGVEIVEKIIEFVDNTKAGILGSVGLILLVYTVVSLLQKIEQAFNYTWRVTEHRPFAQRFSDYITVVLIGPVLLFSALGLTATITSVETIQHMMEIEAIGMMANIVIRLLPYALVIATFTFVYMLVPNTRVKLSSAFIGAVVAGVLWESTSWAFTTFIISSAKYTAIYSAFATLIIFIIWIYMNWLILLIGCSISFYYQNPVHQHLRSRIVRLSNRLRENMAMTIMLLVARRYHQHQSAWTMETLATRLNVSPEACQLIIKLLIESKLLVATSDSPETYLPGHDPETILLRDIVMAVRSAGEREYLSFEGMHREEAVNKVYSTIEQAIEQSLERLSLKDLVMADTNPDGASTAKGQISRLPR